MILLDRGCRSHLAKRRIDIPPTGTTPALLNTSTGVMGNVGHEGGECQVHKLVYIVLYLKTRFSTLLGLGIALYRKQYLYSSIVSKMASLEQSAEAFMMSYAACVINSNVEEARDQADRNARVNKMCDGLLSHYCEKPVSFGLTGIPAQYSKAEWSVRVHALFRRLVETEVWRKVDVKVKRVTVLMDNGNHGACAVHVDWTTAGGDGSGEPFGFSHVYGYRKTPTGHEAFEFVHEDNMVLQLQKRVPGFFSGLSLSSSE